MSLTEILKHNEIIKKRFREEFSKPRIKPVTNLEPIRPRTKTNPGILGTAFDYLFRFHVKMLNPDALERRWIAEEAVDRIRSSMPIEKSTGKWHNGFPIVEAFDEKTREELLCGAIEVVKKAKANYRESIVSQVVTEGLIRSAMQLAKLDLIVRRHLYDAPLDIVETGDIDDLRDLIARVDEKYIKSSTGVCSLNPTFGVASKKAGGADADIVVDHLLLDIKTTIDPRFSREQFDQLMGYYLLHRIGGIDGLPKNHKIKSLGIYSSRFGHYFIFNVEEIADEARVQQVADWFETAIKNS